MENSVIGKLPHRNILLTALFCYALTAMFLMRTVILPAMSPHVTGGHLGGDPQYYHQVAESCAQHIQEQGLRAWQLHPEGQGPAGVFSLIYIITGNQAAIILVNATLHMAACCFLYLLLRRFFHHWTAVLAALPFAASPFQMYLFSQINKDSFVACGGMMLVYGLTRTVEKMLEEQPVIALGKSAVSMMTGAFMIYIGRPYVVLIFQLIAAVIFSGALACCVTGAYKHSRLSAVVKKLPGYCCCCIAMVLVLSPMTKGSASDITIANFESSILSDDYLHYLDEYPEAKICLIDTTNNWRQTPGVPLIAENKLKALFSQRCLYFMQLHDPNPATRDSVLDTRIQPQSVPDAMRYLPRAAAIGLLSPFPHSWFMRYNGKTSTFYSMVAIEVMLFYLSLTGLLYSLLTRFRSLMLVPAAASTGVLVVYGLGVPFIGALYRYRYPFWMILLSLGLGGIITLLNKKRAQDGSQECT